jgi:hypothetical protein
MDRLTALQESDSVSRHFSVNQQINKAIDYISLSN